MDCSPQASLSMRFPRQKYWSGLPPPSPGDLPDPGIEPTSPALVGGFFYLSHQGSPLLEVEKVKEIPRASKLQKSLHEFGYLFGIVFPKSLTGTYLFSWSLCCDVTSAHWVWGRFLSLFLFSLSLLVQEGTAGVRQQGAPLSPHRLCQHPCGPTSHRWNHPATSTASQVNPDLRKGHLSNSRPTSHISDQNVRMPLS